MAEIENQTSWRRALSDSESFRHSGRFFWGCEVLGAAAFAAIVTYFFLPNDPSRSESAIYPLGGVVIGFAAAYTLIYLWNLFRAPYRQRDEARMRAGQLEDAMAKRAAGVEVFCSYPVLHTEQGMPPYGDYILVPGLNIINHMDRPLDCNLSLEITVEGTTFLQNIESSEIVNAPSSLPRGLRGNRQLSEPMRIASDSREVGFAAFSVDIAPPGAVDAQWSRIERLNLIVDDAVNHVQVTEDEVWPSVWPEVFERAASQLPPIS